SADVSWIASTSSTGDACQSRFVDRSPTGISLTASCSSLVCLGACGGEAISSPVPLFPPWCLPGAGRKKACQTPFPERTTDAAEKIVSDTLFFGPLDVANHF